MSYPPQQPPQGPQQQQPYQQPQQPYQQQPYQQPPYQPAPVQPAAKQKNGLLVGAMVCGLIGGILSFLGSLCTTACAKAVDEVTKVMNEAGELVEATNVTWVAYLCGIGGAIVAIVGAAMSLKNGRIAGALMTLGVILNIVLIIVFPLALVMGIFAMILLILAAIFAFVGESKRVKS
ncbi:MAG: hypothetical protein LBL66_01990 [Clostridiales bacterium]|jgi:uncharacterized Tic20 family protein|nr:hypothetical protein [Clostridiales bacterium]